MSGYLARLSARSVGQGTSAQPRLPARFEPPTVVPARDAEQASPVLGPPDPTAERRHAATAGRSPAPGPELAATRPTDSTPVVSVDTRAMPVSPVPGAPPDQPRGTTPALVQDAASLPTVLPGQVPSWNGDPADAAARPAAPPPASSHRGQEPDARPEAPGTMTVVAAVPVTTAAPRPVAPAERETVVQVHIGRVDVRAQLTSPPPVKTGKANTGPDTLGLHDYLRGARESR